jgi:hypothetical protein
MSSRDRRPDRLAWFALAWALVVGLLYCRTVLQARAPGLWASIASMAGFPGA